MDEWHGSSPFFWEFSARVAGPFGGSGSAGCVARGMLGEPFGDAGHGGLEGAGRGEVEHARADGAAVLEIVRGPPGMRTKAPLGASIHSVPTKMLIVPSMT